MCKKLKVNFLFKTKFISEKKKKQKYNFEKLKQNKKEL